MPRYNSYTRTARRKRNYRRNYRNSYRKRSTPTRAIYRKYQYNVPIPRRMSAFGLNNQHYFKLNWIDHYSFAGDNTFGNGRRYRMNSLFDPLYSTGGDQPNGYDEWSNFYEKYRVTGFKLVLDVTSTEENSDEGTHYVSIRYNPSVGATLLPLNKIIANPFSTYKALTFNTGSQSHVRMNYYQKLATLKGAPLSENDESSVINNPITEAVCTWQVADPGGLASNFSFSGLAKVTYYGYFFNPKTNLNPS